MDEAKIKHEMDEVVNLIKSDIAGIRTGRATPSLVENIIIDAYGGTQKLKLIELSSITSPDPQTIVIDPWDKSIIGDIRKGIIAANLGFNPSIDGDIIRISIPPLTTEDRQKFVKLLNSKLEQGKIMIRRIRVDAINAVRDSFEKKQISEDERFQHEKSIQNLVDKYNKLLDELGEAKEKELLG